MEKKKILIIDDDPRNIFALKLTLKSKGFPVLTASSAAEGMQLMREHSGDIAVVLMDMMMPELDGYEALPQIRKEHPISALPVIAVTAQAMVGDKEKCLEAGADGYLSKPIDVDALMRVIDQYLN
jgi:two-component system cell cycle response regulator DivK